MPTIKKFVTIDSNFGTRIINVNSSTTPYRCNYDLYQTFSRLKRVTLSSVEFPICFPNVRANWNVTLPFIINGKNYNAVLLETNYTSIATLVTDLNNACITAINGDTGAGGVAVKLTFSESNGFIRATAVGGMFGLLPSNLAKYMLGYVIDPSKTNYLTNISLVAYNKWTLQADLFFSMYIPQFHAMNTNGRNGLATSFKIPLNISGLFLLYTSYCVFFTENNGFKQYLECTDSSLMFSTITVIIQDQYGNDVTQNILNYSATFCFEMESDTIPRQIQDKRFIQSVFFDSRISNSITTNNPFNGIYNLLQPLQGLRKIYLSSLEMPSYDLTGLTNYFSMSILSFSGINSNFGIGNGTFKIPISLTTGPFYYNDNGSGFIQFIEISPNAVPVTQLQVQLLDRFGNLLGNGGLYDYSFTLTFEGINL